MEIRSVSNAAVNRPTASSTPEAGAATTASFGSTASAGSGDKKSSSAVVGGYISPYINYDQGARVAVLLFRDVETGATQDQIPSRRVVEEYRRTASRLGASTEQSGGKNAKETGAESVAAGVETSTTGSANSGSASNSPSAAALGVSFASTSSTSSSDGGASASTAPVAISGGGGGSPYSGGLVSVTV